MFFLFKRRQYQANSVLSLYGNARGDCLRILLAVVFLVGIDQPHICNEGESDNL